MGQLVDRMAFFDLGVHHANAVFKEWRKMTAGQVAVFIDTGGEHGSAVLTVPRGVVRPAAKKRNTKRCSADNHGKTCWAILYDSGVPISRNFPFVLKAYKP